MFVLERIKRDPPRSVRRVAKARPQLRRRKRGKP
jgi:hypothetical protein